MLLNLIELGLWVGAKFEADTWTWEQAKTPVDTSLVPLAEGGENLNCLVLMRAGGEEYQFQPTDCSQSYFPICETPKGTFPTYSSSSSCSHKYIHFTVSLRLFSLATKELLTFKLHGTQRSWQIEIRSRNIVS